MPYNHHFDISTEAMLEEEARSTNYRHISQKRTYNYLFLVPLINMQKTRSRQCVAIVQEVEQVI